MLYRFYKKATRSNANLSRLQNTDQYKILILFLSVAMSTQKLKERHLQWHQKYEILSNKSHKIYACLTN